MTLSNRLTSRILNNKWFYNSSAEEHDFNFCL